MLDKERNANIEVLSILQVVGHPRDSKRISMLREIGFNVSAAAFERDYHAGRRPDCQLVSLGFIQHGHYFSRVVKIIKSLPKIRRLINDRTIVYASGLDMALLVLLARFGKKSKLILEVGDVRRVQVSAGAKGKLIRWLDRWVAKRCRLLVITARGFETWYYREVLSLDHNFLLIENKLEPVSDDSKKSASLAIDNVIKSQGDIRESKLRIGYFGVLRCEWSLKVLVALAEAAPDQIEIKIAGIPMGLESQIQAAEKISNVSYVGTYKSPEDLSDLYSDVDLVWACYPGIVEDEMWRKAQLICRSNRFYESCYYKAPLLSLSGSGDGIEIEKYDIGYLLTDHNLQTVISELLTINSGQLSRWSTNMVNLPRNVFEYSEEASQLEAAIHKMSKY